MKTDPRTSENQQTLWDFSESLLPRKRVGDFNQALMELGSEVCRPRNPVCDACPLMSLCPSFLEGLQDEIPASGKKMNYEDINEAVVLVQRKGKYLMRLCGPGERWEGLWDFPRYRVDNNLDGKELEPKLQQQFGLSAAIHPTDQRIRHAVTRFRITLDCFVAESVQGLCVEVPARN
jgi:A/G-specific adenine glycosylase